MRSIVSEKQNIGGLREILSLHLQKQLCVLWKGKSRSPVIWLMKAFVLFILSIGCWDGDT